MDVPAINRWAVATAVAAGGALMWVAKPTVDALVEEEMLESSAAVQSQVNDEFPAFSFDDAWEAYSMVKSVDEMGDESNSETIDDVALTATEPVSESQEAALQSENLVDNEVGGSTRRGGCRGSHAFC